MATNIRFRKPTMTNVDGYFFMFDDDTDMLLEITADGTTAFSYPLDVVLGKSIKSTEHDGVNFWTLEDGSGADDMVIKRWKIDNYICKLQQTINLNEDASHKYDSNAFSVEHYHVTVTGTCASGTTTLYVPTGYDDKVSSGMAVTVGPNSNGDSETKNVFAAGTGYITLEDPLDYTYIYGDDVQFYNNIWLFNNYDGLDSTTGALYKINAYTGSYITRYDGGAYKDITAATFYNVDSFTAYGAVDTLAYVKTSNMLFVNVHTGGSTLDYYGSMAMDNIAAGGASVSTIYDVAMDDQNVYRLEQDSSYNYELSTLNSLVSSIALEAEPAIITANQISTSNITAYVKDQFFQPVVGRLVTFGEDDSTGYISGSNPVNTNSEGQAVTVYKSGSTAREVEITATVDQN